MREARTCVLLLGHGSRDPAANAEFDQVVEAYRAAHPELLVRAGFIELARPLFAEALTEAASLASRVVVVPVFLFAAGHVKNDVPLALDEARARFPEVLFVAAPELGVHPHLVNVAWDRVGPLASDNAAARAKTLLLVVGRGASDPTANGDFVKMVRLLAEERGLMHVEPTFLGITEPRLERSLEVVARLRPARLVVLPYLLFAGRLVSRLTQGIDAFRAQHPWIASVVAPHLGFDARLLALIDERAEQAMTGRETLPCDTCQYRTELPGRARQVGGLRALLYSVRHTLTHAQASMPLHTHRPLTKHVLVCGNTDCVDRGSIAVLEGLRREVREAGRTRDIRVTRTACMGRCGEGPTLAVYPDGIWYQRVQAGDAPEITREHLLGDRLVGRLVGDILQ